MNNLRLNIAHSDIPETDSLIATIYIADDPLLTIELKRETDGGLYYLVFEDANPLGDVIEGSYPEYFPEVTV
jgi:hypothetical protein